MMPAQGQPVSLQVPFEQRLLDLQTQIDQLSLTLQTWRQTQDHLQPMERRLARLTEECAGMLESWRTTGDRHAQVVDALETRLAGWGGVEERLQHDAVQRFHELERSIEGEWAALRQLHEEPVKELREQAATLADVCTAAAGSAQTGLERAEARLALLETELHRKMDAMTHEIRGAIASLQSQGEAVALRGGPAPWQLEEVARLHQQLREGSDAGAVNPAALARRVGDNRRDSSSAAPNARAATDLAGTHASDTVDVPDVTDASESSSLEHAGRRPLFGGAFAWLVLGGLVLGLAGALGFTWAMYRQVGVAAAQAAQAQRDAQDAAVAAAERVRATRADAEQQIAQAREAALKAQTVGDVLAAPDLLRFNLVGGSDTGRFFGQVLFSRTRGIVFSGSRLPALPEGSVYQVWLLTAAAPVSAGTFVPDASGRATFATGEPPRIPRSVFGSSITVEPASGSAAPSTAPVLARAQ